MKKFISIFAAMLISFMAFAQTVESSKLFENTYVTVLGGATTTGQFGNVPAPFFWDGAKGVFNGVRPTLGIEVGKYITPTVGFSVEGLGYIGTTTSNTFFDESLVLGNGKLNLSNWLGGYKGQPRRVEVVLVGGLGWGHDYVGNNQTWTSYPSADPEVATVFGRDVNIENAASEENTVSIPATDKNYVAYRAGLELNTNLGKARAWQISVRPNVTWFNKKNGEYQSLATWSKDARIGLQAGVTYKFGSRSKKGHNFVLCPYSVTQADYDAALARIAELEKNPKVKEVTKEVVTERVVEREKVVYSAAKPATTVVFNRGEYALSKAAKGLLDSVVEGLGDGDVVLVTGSADLGTGTHEFNETLAQNRAKVVADYLTSKGAKNVTTDVKFDVNDVPEASRVSIVTTSVKE